MVGLGLKPKAVWHQSPTVVPTDSTNSKTWIQMAIVPLFVMLKEEITFLSWEMDFIWWNSFQPWNSYKDIHWKQYTRLKKKQTQKTTPVFALFIWNAYCNSRKRKKIHSYWEEVSLRNRKWPLMRFVLDDENVVGLNHGYGCTVLYIY